MLKAGLKRNENKRTPKFETLEPRIVLSTVPLITEFMAINDTQYADGDGNFSDWIEIHNPTAGAIDLEGWHLTDNAGNLDKWTFPALPQSVVPAGGYLVVFATSQPTETYIDGGGNLHTDFALSGSGEYLALVDSSMTVAHEYAPTFPAQSADISYGLQESGGVYDLGQPQFFSIPTPGADNGLGAGVVTFSDTSKTFSTNFSLTLTTANPSATIRYTSNGAIPTASSPIYTGPLFISFSIRIRAAVFESGAPQGPTHSESYIKLGSSLTNFQGTGQAFDSNLPLIVFDTFGFQDFDGDGTADVDDGNVRNSNPNFKDDFAPLAGIFINTTAGTAAITDTPEFASRVGMHVRGRTSQFYDKRPYTLEIWGEGHSDALLKGSQTDDQDAPLFGLPAESDWVLNGPFADKSHLNNLLTYQWSNEMGLYAPRTQLVEVFMNPNGGSVNYNEDYRGTYVLTEKIKVGEDRVDIAKIEPTDTAEPDITGGYIWKKDKLEASQGDILSFTTDSGQQLRLVDPDDAEIAPAQLNWLENHINEFENALFGANFADPIDGYAKYIDVASWVDTWLLVEFTKNIDGFRNSTYYHKDRGGKITQGPAWDYNLSLSNANFLAGAFPEGWLHDESAYTNGTSSSTENYPYWQRLFQDPDFVQKIADRWHELRETVLSPTKIIADIDANVAVLTNGNSSPQVGDHTNPISRNFTRWGNVDSFVQFNPWFGQGSYPTNSPLGTSSPTQYTDYLDVVKWFVDTRGAWIDSRFVETPTIAVAGSQVTLTAPDGDIYYTLDGTDPRIGASTTIVEDTLLAAGSQVAVHVPSNGALGTTWTTTGFNDSSWRSGNGGVGYESTTSNYAPYINLDVQAEMYNNPLTPAVYIRAPFIVGGSVSTYDFLTLQIQYDDGFVAYLNGTPVAMSDNVPASPDWNDQTTTDHPDAQAEQFTSFDISAHLGLLQPGENVLAIHGINNGSGSSDFLISPRIVAGVGTSGNFSPSAVLYTGPFNVSENALITARAYDTSHTIAESSNFSGLANQGVVLVQPNIVVSEINYHPHEANLVAGLGELAVENEQFEFIEILNPSATTAANLIGVQLTGELEYRFTGNSAFTEIAPNGRALVVRNQAAFESRYGTGLPIAGEFANSTGLSSNELVRLDDGVGNTIQQFTYLDSGDWPNRADGNGSSLVVIDTSGDYNDPKNWRSSIAFGGTPGAAPLPDIPNVVVNEVLAHTDLPVVDQIELANVSGTSVDISGWWLSDSNDNYFKYQIAGSTNLTSGAYITFDESQFNSGVNSFALSAAGDDVWLIEVDGSGRPIRFADRVEFDATLNDVSLGRIPNGSGELFPLTASSLGSANGAHQPGDIVISELHYHPAPPPGGSSITEKQLEFVELTNRSGASILLTDWRLRGSVDFDFPSGINLAEGARLVLVSFDPNNSTLDAEFRAIHGITGSVTLLGPWTDGALDNSGGTVKLLAPTTPPAGDPGPVHYLVDRVIYIDSAPWPTSADGAGLSLQRTSTENYGDAPTSWNAAIPTPGGVQAAGTPSDFDSDSDVDGTDFLAWQRGFGIASGAAVSDGDANNDGTVNAADLSIWETSYGTIEPLGAIAAPLKSDTFIDGIALATSVPDPSASLDKTQSNIVSHPSGVESALVTIWSFQHPARTIERSLNSSPKSVKSRPHQAAGPILLNRAVEAAFSQFNADRISDLDYSNPVDDLAKTSLETALEAEQRRITDKVMDSQLSEN